MRREGLVSSCLHFSYDWNSFFGQCQQNRLHASSFQGMENQIPYTYTCTYYVLTSDRQYLAKRMNWKSSQLSDSQKQLRVGRRSACRPVHSKSLSKCGGKSSLPWGQGKGPRMWTLGLLRLPCAADVARPLWEKACENTYPHFPFWYSQMEPKAN